MTTDKSGRTSAGILLWRRRDGRLEVLLAHQGGPYWVNKDLGHWTIPKARSRGERSWLRSLAESSRRKPATSSPETEWPPGSGRVETFPEIDRVEWFKLNKARRKPKAAQVPFLDRLQSSIAAHR